MNELNKIRQISCIISTGAINFDDTIYFNVGDKNTAFIQLRSTIPNYIQVRMKIKTPNGEVVLIPGKAITAKNACREFAVVVDEPGEYVCQLEFSWKDQVNISNTFKYEVLKGIEGGI